MKKISSMILAVTMLLSFLLVPSNALSTPVSKSSNDAQVSDIQVSDIMTFEEMVARYAQVGGISYQEALKAFPSSRALNVNAYRTYRTLSVTLNVTNTYRPTLEFYCEVSVGDGVWGIVSIYSVQMNRMYNGISKQFSGDVQVWLRGPLSIEYVVNGDFYNNGTTTTSGGTNLNLGIDEVATIGFSASSTTSTNHYQYCYQHQTATF